MVLYDQFFVVAGPSGGLNLKPAALTKVPGICLADQLAGLGADGRLIPWTPWCHIEGGALIASEVR